MTTKALQAKQSLAKFKLEVDAYIKTILDEELEVAKDFTSQAEHYIQELRNLALHDGKRLRPSFVYYTYLMYHGKNIEAIMKVAAAIELVHVFFLVEDDYMDLADTRRGYPTIHNTYTQFHKKNSFKKDSLHFGHTIAVNVGIICDHAAINAIVNADFESPLIKKALNQLNRQIITTGHGQIHDMLNEVRSNLTEQDIINVLYWKTGIYTYNNPIQVGAILAGADEDQLKRLAEYAIPGGVAFQIQDDILGSFGDESKTGKSADGDIKEGKQTLLTYHAYRNGSKRDREVLDEVIGNQQASDADIKQVREIFVKTGAYDLSKQRAQDLVKEAKEALLKNDHGQWQEQGRDYLEGIADYMIEREL